MVRFMPAIESDEVRAMVASRPVYCDALYDRIGRSLLLAAVWLWNRMAPRRARGNGLYGWLLDAGAPGYLSSRGTGG